MCVCVCVFLCFMLIIHSESVWHDDRISHDLFWVYFKRYLWLWLVFNDKSF